MNKKSSDDVLENVLMPMMQSLIKRLNHLDSRISIIEQKMCTIPIKLSRREPIDGNILYKGAKNGSGSLEDAN